MSTPAPTIANDVLTLERRGKVAVLTLTNGENKQNLAFAEAMKAALADVESDASVKSLVITSSDEKNWSQGVDLNWLMAAMHGGKQDDIRAFMYAMNDVFAALLTLPVPVIGALTGHAFGNGAMLACCCDFRVMRADRGYFCFPEVDISIPFLPSMIAFTRKAIPEPRFNDLILSGRRATAEDLLADKVITAAFPDAEATLAGALELAEGFSKSRAIFGELKRRMHRDILRVMREEDPAYIDPLNLTV
ncbi:MAG: enoyl-CoA hydratase/isomerase family protein [Pseudomonadota bacterium]